MIILIQCIYFYTFVRIHFHYVINCYMRFIQFVFYVLFFSFSLSSFGQEKSTLVFNNVAYDFGTINEVEGKVSYRFVFLNNGKTPIIIRNVDASCGCTSPKWSKKPILPNKEGWIDVVFNPRNRPGNFTKTLKVYSNTNLKIHSLKITGNVIPKIKTILDEYPFELPSGIRLQFNKLAFMKVRHESSKLLEVKFLNNSDKTVNLSFKDLPQYVKLIYISKNVRPRGEGIIRLKFFSTKSMLLGLLERKVRLCINDLSDEILLTADIREDFRSLSSAELHSSPRISVDKKVYKLYVNNGKELISRDVTISNKGESILFIRRIYSTNGKCSYLIPRYKLSPRDSTILRITMRASDIVKNKSVIIRIISNDPRKQEIKLRFIVKTKD